MTVQHDLALFDIPAFSEDSKSVFIYSDDGSCKEWMTDKLNTLRHSYSLVYRATGLEDNISEIVSKVSGEKAHYFPGDGKRVFIRKYPEYFCVINNNAEIADILDEWVSTIYEYRVLYIVNPRKRDALISILEESADSNKNALELIMGNIDGYIENARDAPDHDSYIINLKNDVWNKIGGVI